MSHYPEPIIQGAGIGLRHQHMREILTEKPSVNWFEALSENYFGEGGMALYYLDLVRRDYPIVLHSVGLSIASSDPLNEVHVGSLKRLKERFEPACMSDHLAWCSQGGRYLHELLPVPYTNDALEHICGKIDQLQEILKIEFAFENPSTYLSFTHSDMEEWEFLSEMTRRTGCKLLVDINNLYVNAQNHGFDPMVFLHALPKDSVRQIHLAGYEKREGYLYDTHGYRVHPPVWDLYEKAIDLWGPVPTLIEWDTDIPEFSVLKAEAARASEVLAGRVA